MSCYVCLESFKPLYRKSCGCGMLVHASCLQKELENGRLTCSVCNQAYATSHRLHWKLSLARALCIVVLVLDELWILVQLRFSLFVLFTTLYLNLCLAFALYLPITKSHIYVHVVLPPVSPSSND